MQPLAEFQAQFASSLLKPAPAVHAHATRNDKALSVYRNTVMKGLIDALAANFPTVQRLVGDDWFTGAAAEFARQHPPHDPVLAHYGAEFPSFLAQFPPAMMLPYLSAVAQLDRIWMDAYFAADDTPSRADDLQGLDEAGLFNCKLSFHPTARYGRFAHSAVTIWLANHPIITPNINSTELEVADEMEAILLVRPEFDVHAHRLSAEEYTFVQQLHTQPSLGAAAMAMLTQQPQFPIPTAVAKFINLGLFTRYAAIQAGNDTSIHSYGKDA